MARGAAPPLDPDALKDARLAAGLSQAALARAAGTDRRQIIRYENGEERPEIGRLAALAQACEVTVADLVNEDDLPPGLAGLRIGAGLTMAAAATALAEHIDPATGIATNRASLSGAEKGRLPLSWRPAPAGSRVRGAMVATYETGIDAVRAAWEVTFPNAPHHPPAPRKETDHQGGDEVGSLNTTPDEGATQTPPPHPYPSLAESAVRVWGSSRLASQGWRIRARIREADGNEVEAAATGTEGHEPVVSWWACERGLSRTVQGQVIQALEWSSPWRSMPDAVPSLPGARREPASGDVELPFIDQAPSWMRELPVCPYSPAELAAYRLKTVGDGLYEVRVDHTAQGRVRRDGPGRWSFAALDPETGRPRSYVPVIAKRPTRTQAVEALLSTPGPLWSRPTPTLTDDYDPPQEPVDVQEQATPTRAAVVLTRSAVIEDRTEYVRYLVRVDDVHIGHIQEQVEGTGWVFQARLSAEDQVRLTLAEQAAPDAVSEQADLVEAVPELLATHYGHPLQITSLSGERTDLPIRPRDMERWELRKGRVRGREDVFVRSRCWGWLQRADGGFTAHTVDGPVPGSLAPTREEAAQALWAHLTAPLPPPNLGEQARTKRRLRPVRDARPLCPYSDAELARVRLIRDRPEVEHSPYRAESPADHRVLGYVWRKDARRWAYAPATGRTPEYSPALPTAPTRAAALEALLARPGPLWADPDSAIVH